MPGFDHFQKELSRVIFQKMKAPGETISYPETFPLLKQHLLLIFCRSGGRPGPPSAISPARGVSAWPREERRVEGRWRGVHPHLMRGGQARGPCQLLVTQGPVPGGFGKGNPDGKGPRRARQGRGIETLGNE